MFDNYGDSNAPAAGDNNFSSNIVNNPVPPVEPTLPNNVVNSPNEVQTNTSVPSWVQPNPSISAPPSVPTASATPVFNQPDLSEPELPPAPSALPIEPPKPPEPLEPAPKPVHTPDTTISIAPSITNEEGLETAAREVVKLYLDYRLKLALGQEPKLEVWEQTTKKFPDFAQKIHDLGEALKDAEKIKKEAFPEADTIIQRINFHNVEDEASRMLLTDILWRRATTNTGKFDRDMSLPEEGMQMIREMGFSEDNADEKLEISPRHIVEKILSGKLRISPSLS